MWSDAERKIGFSNKRIPTKHLCNLCFDMILLLQLWFTLLFLAILTSQKSKYPLFRSHTYLQTFKFLTLLHFQIQFYGGSMIVKSELESIGPSFLDVASTRCISQSCPNIPFTKYMTHRPQMQFLNECEKYPKTVVW